MNSSLEPRIIRSTGVSRDPMNVHLKEGHRINEKVSSPALRFANSFNVLGSSTMLSLFNVGIYSDKDPDGAVVKTFVGSGFGETLDIAVDMAAKDSLRSFFGLHPGVRLVHGQEARKLNIDLDARNWSIAAL